MATPALDALSPPPTKGLSSIGPILAVAITSQVGVHTTYFAPIEIGAIIDRFGLSAAKGGTIVSVELGFVALTSLLAGGWLSRANSHRIAILSCFFVAAVNIACAFPITDVLVLVGLRALAGIGAGLAFAISCIWTARSPQPARIFGIGVVLVSLVTAVAMLPLSSIAGQGGLPTVFLSIGLILTAATILLFWFHPAQRSDLVSDIDHNDMPVGNLSRLGLYSAVILSNMALSIIWQFAERLGRQYGFGVTDIGFVLSISVAVGIGGSVAAALVGDRFGYSRPLLAGMALGSLCGVLVSVQSGYVGYAIAIALSEFGFLFIMPFLIGIGSWLDSSGKLAAVAGGLALTASAISPIVGGTIVDLLSASASGWACAVFSLMAMVGLIPIAMAERSHRFDQARPLNGA